MLALVCNDHRLVWSASTTISVLTTLATLVATEGKLMEALLQEFAPCFVN
jgi:hypothetical protein